MRFFKEKHNIFKIGLLHLLLIFVVAAAGCALIDRLQAWKQGGEDTAPLAPGETDATQAPEEVLTGETKEIALYFSDESGQHLVCEMRTIPKVEGIARAAVQELIAGPSVDSGLLPTIPVGTRLRDINVRPDGLCIVDFSGELVQNHPGGSANEGLTVYSIVDTITQFPTVQEVQILVDGKKVETIAGHVDVSSAMARNEEIIRDK